MIMTTLLEYVSNDIYIVSVTMAISCSQIAKLL